MNITVPYVDRAGFPGDSPSSRPVPNPSSFPVPVPKIQSQSSSQFQVPDPMPYLSPHPSPSPRPSSWGGETHSNTSDYSPSVLWIFAFIEALTTQFDVISSCSKEHLFLRKKRNMDKSTRGLNQEKRHTTVNCHGRSLGG